MGHPPLRYDLAFMQLLNSVAQKYYGVPKTYDFVNHGTRDRDCFGGPSISDISEVMRNNDGTFLSRLQTVSLRP